MTARINPDSGPMFAALAQPVLRGPDGRTLTVVPGQGGAPIAVQPWPPTAQGQAPWCWGHAQPHDALPWLASNDSILALLQGHRPLTIKPGQPFGGNHDSRQWPYSDAVCTEAGGLTVFFVNGTRDGEQVRWFAVDGQQAVELPPLANAQVHVAWASGGALWAAGMRPRPPQYTERDDFGHALLMRFELRPLALQACWQGRLWPLCESATPPEQWARIMGVEAWVHLLPGLPGDERRWLLGLPLVHGEHDLPPDLTAFWMVSAISPSEYDACVLACAPASSDDKAPLLLTQLLDGYSPVACCPEGHTGRALVFLFDHRQRWDHQVQQLCISQWDAAAARLEQPLPMHIEGLPAIAPERGLADLDAIHHQAFGFAALLTWSGGDASPFRREAALLHSPDGRHWRVMQLLEASAL